MFASRCCLRALRPRRLEPMKSGARCATKLVAVGDEVILIRLDQRMPEEARATTDAHGAFTFNPQHSDRPYLVRVMHHSVDYHQRAVAGDILSVRVFDVASRVPNVTGSIEILRTGTNVRRLHVSDMYEITNESSPP